MRRPGRGPVPLLVGLLGPLLAASLGACSGAAEPAGPDEQDAPSASRSVPPADPDEVTTDDFEAIADLMDRRAAALLHGRRAAFLATVDPADDRLLREQETLFDNLQALPVTRISYGVGTSGLEAADVEGDDPVVRPQVVEHVRLAGVLEKPVANPLAMTFVRRDDGWLVGHEVDAEDFPAQERPWFGDPIDVARDGDLLALADSGGDVAVADVLLSVRDDLAAVAAVLDEEADEPLLVDATSNGLARELSNASGENAGAVSFDVYAATPLGDDYTARAGAVVKLNPEIVDDLVSDRHTMRHELTHFLLNRFTAANPQWVGEGIAEYVSLQPALLRESVLVDPRFARQLAARRVELPGGGTWGGDPVLDYLVARAAAEHLIQTYGLDRYLEMMREFDRRWDGVLFGEGKVDDVLREVYGVREAEVAREAFALLEGVGG